MLIILVILILVIHLKAYLYRIDIEYLKNIIIDDL